MDILDTSALRCLSTANLVELTSRRILYVSPLSVYELLCHLDEVRKGKTEAESYLSARGQVLKARNLKLLPDSYAFIAESVGQKSMYPEDPRLELEAVSGLLDALAACPSIEELGRYKWRLSSGESMSFAGAEYVQEMLRKLENRFMQSWRGSVDRIERGPGREQAKVLAAKEFWDVAYECAGDFARKFERKKRLRGELRLKIFDALFVYFGCQLARVSHYLTKQSHDLIFRPFCVGLRE